MQTQMNKFCEIDEADHISKPTSKLKKNTPVFSHHFPRTFTVQVFCKQLLKLQLTNFGSWQILPRCTGGINGFGIFLFFFASVLKTTNPTGSQMNWNSYDAQDVLI